MTELKTAEEIFNDTELNSLGKHLTFGDKITEAMKTHTRQWLQFFAEKVKKEGKTWIYIKGNDVIDHKIHPLSIDQIEKEILEQIK